MSHTDWRDHANCRSEHVDSELFFLPRTAGQTVAALEICATCPVQPSCQDTALRSGITDGIWGGLTEEDREEIWRAEPDLVEVA